MGRSVVVTGANRGIGLASALELAKAEFDVIGTVRSEEAAEQLRRAAEERRLTVRQVRLDVADPESTGRGFEQVAEMTDGGPWAVVNNAGYVQAGAVEDVTPEAARAVLEVNLLGPARIAQLVLPTMRARGEGRIVNVSSIAGRISLPMLGWYCASKHALETLTDALRIEVARFGVKVSLVEPGSFGTGAWESARFPSTDHLSRPEYSAAYDRMRAAQRGPQVLPDPVWVARVIRLALTSRAPLARYMVGIDTYLGVIQERLAPTVVTDLAKGVSTGLRGLPFIGRRAD